MKLLDELPQKRIRTSGIVDIARTVSKFEELARLREMGKQGIVALVLLAMRIKATAHPSNLVTRLNHAPLQVDRETTQFQT